MSKPLSFQQVIMRLEHFWADQGCIIWQPYSEKVGAGTMNPATVLRVLGPEPWNVGYVEPSYRPADGRYGENPNRMQMFIQYQVILKPDPGNPQELYLRSLEALGINPRQHDIRFVEDNWEAPALGAWGLGWEVWLDGLEISQYTYFQQAGGFSLDPVSVELTYGLERIVMFLQGVRSVWDIDWGAGLGYGDVLLASEVEHCVYAFEQADVEALTQLFRIYEAEARNALARGLVIPAHDYVLRCSHTFNVLDTRGAIGVTERAHYFARMRDLSREVAQAYVAQREEMGYPELKRSWVVKDAARQWVNEAAGQQSMVHFTDSEPADSLPFLLEIGTEELPAGDLTSAIEQLREQTPKLLAEARLEHGQVRVTGTPRRLAVYLESLAPKQQDREELVKGPPAKVAYDAEGKPTKAAQGFARGQGVSVDDLEVREMDGGQYVVATRVEEGKPTPEVLAKLLPQLISVLRFNMTMRWNESGVAFSRPIRWLVALLGDQAIPFEYAGVQSGCTSRGLRPLGSPELAIKNASDYFGVMAAHSVIVDTGERRASIEQQINRLAAEVGGQIPADPALLEEVTNLVEQPTAVGGAFEEEYLSLPRDVLITVMKKHQRYFPVVSDSETVDLLPYFIAVRNGDDQHLDIVRRGYEEVLRARYADADFFYKGDTSKSLEEFLPRLDTLTFQEKLGSMLDKTRRLEQLVPRLGQMLGLSEIEIATATRAAHLCKADLATQMVVEFTSLQGVMGQEYARKSGESDGVARAILEHYLPRFAGDILPETRPGLTVGLANRLDSLVGLFAVGLAPTGSADPYHLRRDALGVVNNLIAAELSFDLRAGLKAAAKLLPVEVPEGTLEHVLAFIVGRLEGVLREQGYRYDVVAAVLAERGHNPYLTAETVRALVPWIERDDWMDILNAYARCVRIVRDLDQTYPLAPALFAEPATERLYQAYLTCLGKVGPESTVDELFAAFQPMIEPINTFFDEVLVMTEDKALRENRLALLQHIARLTEGIIDLTKVEGF
ncbi:MAG: glycine--tRNA ligase subunit beta [Anaerolineae bacterium]|nr:glycine--tRNA ligase subunit beta [Anaerolineae bacterium]